MTAIDTGAFWDGGRDGLVRGSQGPRIWVLPIPECTWQFRACGRLIEGNGCGPELHARRLGKAGIRLLPPGWNAPIDTVEQMAQDLRVLGVRDAGTLMVHSSLRALGWVEGGPETVIRALLEALGPEGTLLLPALSYEVVTAANPVFDARRTPANVGAIPEAFRTRPGTLRSVHPTHSVCGVGRLAGALLGDHILDSTPCGAHSPFRKLRDVGGQILMLGCGLRPNTSMHGIEELAEPPYLFGDPLTYQLIFEDGHSETKVYRRHGFRGWEQRYDRVADVLQAPALVEGRVLSAGAHLIEASALWEAVTAKLRRDPLYFVDRVSEE